MINVHFLLKNLRSLKCLHVYENQQERVLYGHMEKQETEIKRKLEMETENGN